MTRLIYCYLRCAQESSARRKSVTQELEKQRMKEASNLAYLEQQRRKLQERQAHDNMLRAAQAARQQEMEIEMVSDDDF
jgi:threonine aldolase